MVTSAADWAWFLYWAVCGALVGTLAREAERVASKVRPPRR